MMVQVPSLFFPFSEKTSYQKYIFLQRISFIGDPTEGQSNTKLERKSFYLIITHPKTQCVSDTMN